MRKVISIIVAVGFISTMSVNNSYAGHGGINPLWVPVAILSTIAAITIAQPPPVVYERRVQYEPRPVVIVEKPRYSRHVRYYESDRGYYETPRHYRYR